ncbi:histone deacetylase clr3 [Coprinopsis marcescibilis]|uniref:histone deacetylase n=1 Tax=Coprinopsis marcescibilis TaxID=230819 RepID=A0A5C3KYL2_COPMA|nr:histone deacetylase clr3 [Coprinopsis marcescibilis]
MDGIQEQNNDAMDIDRPGDVEGTSRSTNGIAGPSSLTRQWSTPVPRQPRASSMPLTASEYTVGYVYSVDMMMHFSLDPHGHPEQPNRIKNIWQTLVKEHLTERMKWLPIRPVKKEEAMLVHGEDHWDKVIQIQHMNEQERVDSQEYYEGMSLYVMPGTTRAALLSCGGVIEASLAVARGELKKSFAIVRPPGHHAEPNEHMGFCFFNNAAVAARVVQQLTPIKRILILDWDVHHGNGTQRAFNDDPSVLYMSLHRYEQGTYYPCGPFGSMESCGVGAGEGYSVNVPWPNGGMEDADYLHAFQKVIIPIAMEFSPELVIISAGFDAAEGDDLGECHVSPAGYAHMTHMLAGLAGGRMVVALEGGYNLDAISQSALAVTKVLLGGAPDPLPPLVASEEATEAVWQVAKFQSKYWKSLDPKTCEPQEELEEISFSIPEILKAHRQHHLYTQYGMMQIPLMTPELEQLFSTQIMCTQDMLENETLVFFVHEFGNLMMELESSAVCDISLHRSYLLDFSKQLINWVTKENFALIDANLYPKPIDAQYSSPRNSGKSTDDSARDVLMYLWDNFVQLSSAKHIIVIGHGPGCRPLIDLLNRRAIGMMKNVVGFIQIVGLQQSIIASPNGMEDVRQWYRDHSLVVLPPNHPILAVKGRETRKHGKFVPISEGQQLKLVMKALPVVQEFVRAALLEAVNGEVPSNANGT